MAHRVFTFGVVFLCICCFFGVNLGVFGVVKGCKIAQFLKKCAYFDGPLLFAFGVENQ